MAENFNLIRAPLEMYTAADIEPKEVKWLWYPYIPFGKVTLIQGDSGDGKSTFALNLAALLTRGDALPFTGVSHEPMRVIYLNAEDDADDTVVPRFMKANGDRSRLFFISEEKRRLNFSDDRIREAIVSTGARVCILDPLASYLGADVSMNLANEVRPRFESLIEVARETGCAIIVVIHMNKAEGMNAKYRASGSGDIVAAARSVVVIGRPRDDEGPDHRVMAHSKSNLAPLGSSILFSVRDGVVEFIDTIDITADQLVGAYGAAKARETKRAGHQPAHLRIGQGHAADRKCPRGRMLCMAACQQAKGQQRNNAGRYPFYAHALHVSVAPGSPEGMSGPRILLARCSGLHCIGCRQAP